MPLTPFSKYEALLRMGKHSDDEVRYSFTFRTHLV